METTSRTEFLNPIDLVHGAYYWLRLSNKNYDNRDCVVDTKSPVYGFRFGLYIGQCTISKFRERVGYDGPADFDEIYFDVCGDEDRYPARDFEVLEIIEYKGDK